MIVSFKDKDTEKLWLGEFVRRLDGIRKQALMRLGRLEAATPASATSRVSPGTGWKL